MPCHWCTFAKGVAKYDVFRYYQNLIKWRITGKILIRGFQNTRDLLLGFFSMELCHSLQKATPRRPQQWSLFLTVWELTYWEYLKCFGRLSPKICLLFSLIRNNIVTIIMPGCFKCSCKCDTQSWVEWGSIICWYVMFHNLWYISKWTCCELTLVSTYY